MLTYNAVEGQSLWDICLNTYGSFDLLRKLLDDNSIPDINYSPYSGQSFVWDETLTTDQAVNIINQNSNIRYATKVNPNDSMKTIVNGGSSGNPADGGNSGSGIPGGGGAVVSPALLIYFGAVSTLTPIESVVKALSSRPALKQDQIYSASCSNQRFCFAYPAAFGSITSVKDTNGFEILSGFTQSSVIYTIDGTPQNYTLMVLTSPCTVTNFNLTFSFS